MRNRLKRNGHLLLAVALAALAGACGDSPAARDITGPDITTPVRAPASLEAVTPTALAGTVGVRIDGAPTVRVRDANGRPLAGVVVNFRQESVTTTVTSAADGTASFAAWTLGTRAGSQTLAASVPGVSSVVFTAVAAPGPAAKLTRYSGWNQVGDAGKSVGRLVAKVVDAFDNPVEGIAVHFAVSAGGGSIDASSPSSDADGLATSGDWILGAVGANAVVASSPGLASQAFNVVAFPPEAQRMVYVREPYDGRSPIGGREIIVLTTVASTNGRSSGNVFFAGVSDNLSWGAYSISDTGDISLTVIAGDWFAWADKPLSGWHTEEEVGLTVWVDGPDYYAHIIYRRHR